MTINATRQKDLGITVPGQSSGRFAAAHHDESLALAHQPVNPPRRQRAAEAAARAWALTRAVSRQALVQSAVSFRETIRDHFPNAVKVHCSISYSDSGEGIYVDRVEMADGTALTSEEFADEAYDDLHSGCADAWGIGLADDDTGEFAHWSGSEELPIFLVNEPIRSEYATEFGLEALSPEHLEALRQSLETLPRERP